MDEIRIGVSARLLGERVRYDGSHKRNGFLLEALALYVLRDAIEDHRQALLPVAVPLALLSAHLRAAGDDWARAQSHLHPYPKQLGVRGVIARRP
jgi:uncharacterized protein YbgA (DUF1722 family)